MDNISKTTDASVKQPVHGRRNVLRVLTGMLGTLGAAVLGIPVVGYFLGIRKGIDEWVDLGPVADFPPHETRRVVFDNPLKQPWDGMTSETIVYAQNKGPEAGEGDQFQVLSAHCAHLGCPVSWFPQSGLFMCPCHGGVYYANGERASGPPPRGLYHCVWRVEGGRLFVQSPHYPTLQDPLVPVGELS